jgi:hypothetical protein
MTFYYGNRKWAKTPFLGWNKKAIIVLISKEGAASGWELNNKRKFTSQTPLMGEG